MCIAIYITKTDGSQMTTEERWRIVDSITNLLCPNGTETYKVGYKSRHVAQCKNYHFVPPTESPLTENNIIPSERHIVEKY